MTIIGWFRNLSVYFRNILSYFMTIIGWFLQIRVVRCINVRFFCGNSGANFTNKCLHFFNETVIIIFNSGLLLWTLISIFPAQKEFSLMSLLLFFYSLFFRLFLCKILSAKFLNLLYAWDVMQAWKHYYYTHILRISDRVVSWTHFKTCNAFIDPFSHSLETFHTQFLWRSANEYKGFISTCEVTRDWNILIDCLFCKADHPCCSSVWTLGKIGLWAPFIQSVMPAMW